MGGDQHHDDVRMNATFSPNAPMQGNVGFLSQSGALGLAVIEYANSLSLGLSTFISIGNKADLSGNDFIQYWADDPATDVIALYLESLGNPRKFARITRRVGRQKTDPRGQERPLLGRCTRHLLAHRRPPGRFGRDRGRPVQAGRRHSHGHPGRVLRRRHAAGQPAAAQWQPRRHPDDGGGPGILCADACEADGLVVPQVPDAIKAGWPSSSRLRPASNNRSDMIAGGPAGVVPQGSQDPGRVGRHRCHHHPVRPVLVTTPEGIAAGIREAALDLPREIPLLSVFLSSDGTPASSRPMALSLPSYPSRRRRRALAHAVRYGIWAQTPEGRRAALRRYPRIRRQGPDRGRP